MSKQTIIILMTIFVISAGFIYFAEKDANISNGSIEKSKKIDLAYSFGNNQKVTIYKSPNCGCCVGYAKELKKRGFNVDIIKTEDMEAVKEKYGILQDKQSCHTMIAGDYFVEGHVPMEAVKKLLKEKPKIDGIGLPRMPSGTPGMPGPKRAPYKVYQSKDDVFSEFLTI
jgi:hypothetical protein